MPVTAGRHRADPRPQPRTWPPRCFWCLYESGLEHSGHGGLRPSPDRLAVML